MRVHAPAKINLGLRVLCRRADGYHELESLFVPLDLADTLEVAVRTAERPEVTLRVTPDTSAVPAGPQNLAARAARAFLEAAGLRCRVDIALTKATPAAAGLGGGSSDAGAVLRALSQQFPGALDCGALRDVACGLGSDVPFFLDPKPCWVRGVGEQLTPVAALPALPLLLVNPGSALSTAEVYRAFDALHPDWRRRPAPPPDARALSTPDDRTSALSDWVENDLEAAALRLCPSIGRIRTRLLGLGARAVGMSGSGATLYGIFADAAGAAAARAAAGFTPPVWARVATTRESG